MSFLIVILVLFVDRVLWHADPYRQHSWFDRYLAALRRSPLGGVLGEHAWSAVLIIALPVALIGWLQAGLMPVFGPLFEFALGAVVLLLSLGPEELGRSVEDYQAATKAGDRQRASRLAGQLSSDPASSVGEATGVVHGVLAAACQRLLGPLFWFVLFGAVGAAAYRLAQLLQQRQADSTAAPTALTRGAHNLAYVLNWAPVRVTAAGYAVAGNFDAVAAAWKQCSQSEGEPDCPSDTSLLIATGEAALEQSSPRSEAMLIEDSVALVWRNLTLWVLFLGSLTLFSL